MVFRRGLFRLSRFHNFLFGFAFFLGCLFAVTFMKMYSCKVPSIETLINSDGEELNPFLMVLILSSPDNYAKRQAIRQTWINLNSTITQENEEKFYDNMFIPKYRVDGFLNLESVNEQRRNLHEYEMWTQISSYKIKEKHEAYRISTANKVKHLFVVGTKNLKEKDIMSIKDEAVEHKDIILLEDHMDKYQNLTMKLLLSLRNITEKYQFKYLLKCDDDSYVRLNMILKDLVNYRHRIERHYGNYGNYGNYGPPPPELYWGYFNGRATIQKHGPWTETNFIYAERYLPYALGGGYVLSYNLVKFMSDNLEKLNTFVSEDISVGLWTAPFRNIHRRHDIRFDTGSVPRDCQEYHLVMHKRTPNQMESLYKKEGDICREHTFDQPEIIRPKAYFYDWNKNPVKCCDNFVIDKKKS